MTREEYDTLINTIKSNFRQESFRLHKNTFRNHLVAVKMAASKLGLGSLKLLRNYDKCKTYSAVQKLYCSSQSGNEKPSSEVKTGFAKFNEEQYKFVQDEAQAHTEESFATLLRNSKFVDMGDPVGKEVIGEIYRVVNDDLYIDFGWKFPAVCTRPPYRKELYVPGEKVRLLIKELELASVFLGSSREISLQEADCTLLGLAKKRSLL